MHIKLVTSVVSSDYHVISYGYSCGIYWLPLWYPLVTPVVSSEYPCGILWLLLWYHPVTSVVSSGYHCCIF
jgi:hypothetical protein